MVRARKAASGVQLPPPSPEHPVNFGAACDGSFCEDEGIPSVVFGPGDLRIAHCKDENVSIDEVIGAAQSLAVAALDWCGVAGEGGVT